MGRARLACYGRAKPVATLEEVRVEQVSRLFGRTAALRGVSAVLRAGEVVLLEGPNGAGKSTLLGVIGTTLRPSSGRVVYGALGADPAAVRGEIGWVSHDSHCYGALGARRNVELMAQLQGVDGEARWASLAPRLGLAAFADKPVASLSRGQRQRVALARALVHRPALLLLDEPWTGLDADSAATLDDVVREERDGGAIVVVVSHEIGVAERLGARRIRLVQGRIVSDER